MKTANAVEKFRRIERLALETMLDLAALIVLFLGFICGAAVALLTLGGLGILDAVLFSGLSLLGGILGWGLLSAAAENLRVTKSSAGLEYAGKISGTHYVPYMACSECGARLLSIEKCQCCDAEIVDSHATSHVG